MKTTLLIVEAQSEIKRNCRKIFGHDDIHLIEAESGPAAIKYLDTNIKFDGIILDYEITGEKSIDYITKIKSKKPGLPIIIAGQTDTENLVKLLKSGVDDFVEKPLDDQGFFLEAINKYIAPDNFIKKETNIDSSVDTMKCDFIGESQSSLDLKKMIKKVAPLDSTILILGETGTGKEVVSKMIHTSSPQKDQNFVAVHCGGIPDTLLESALFGHEKGSFTGAYKTHKGYFEIANNGTIFLDEIGDTTPSMQVKLLRILQNKEFRRIGGTTSLKTNARIIAATNRDLEKMVQEGTFRQDLYYRLNVITLKLAPLKERRDDIPLLVRYFLQKFTRKHNRLGVYLKPETIDLLCQLDWPGNIRELENVIERLTALSDSDWIGPEELPADYKTTKTDFDFMGNMPLIPYSEAKSIFEREYIVQLLNQASGNISQAANLAKMPRQNLHLKIKKYSLKASASCKVVNKTLKEPVVIDD